MAENKASLGTFFRSSELLSKLPCTPLKLSVLAASVLEVGLNLVDEIVL